MQTLKKLTLSLVLLLSSLHVTKAQNFTVILGRPTNNSITASILFDQNVQFYLEYGIVSGTYTGTTATYTGTMNITDEVDMTNLQPDTRYYYRVRHQATGATTFAASQEYTFHTQRAPGSTFTFTVEADEHLYDKKGVQSIYRHTLANEANDNPDFMLSLGDIFGDDHYPNTITAFELDSLHEAYRPFLGQICHSIPFYVCLGNHEGENDYYYAQNPPNNLSIWATQARKTYYPNPYPNAFYSGNTAVEPYGIGHPENYYAWEWGDALFVVLDVYRDQCDTSPKPKNWSWSLGLPQYTWLEQTLQNSTATHKFVFAHHVRGQGRGALLEAQLFEWGGRESLTGPNTFATNRPGWSMPIHDLFTTYGVNIFFQGHDHLFAHEVLNGVTYQEVPMPSDSTYQIGMLANADAYTADTIDGTGYIRVTVSPNCVNVDYVRSYLPADTLSGLHHDGEVAFSYTVGNCATGLSSLATQKMDVQVFPNPATNYLTVRVPDTSLRQEYVLTDNLGKTVLRTTSQVLDVTGLSNGVYSLAVYSGDTVAFKKVTICR
jgi:hypothetical protein